MKAKNGLYGLMLMTGLVACEKPDPVDPRFKKLSDHTFSMTEGSVAQGLTMINIYNIRDSSQSSNLFLGDDLSQSMTTPYVGLDSAGIQQWHEGNRLFRAEIGKAKPE